MYPTTKDFTKPVSVVIKSGAALSNAIDIRRYPSAGYIAPDAWTAASLGFQVSFDGVDYFPLKSSTDTVIEHTMTVTPSKGSVFPAEIAPFAFVKLWSETAGISVNQDADRTFIVGTKG